MATLTFAAGPVTSVISAANAKADAVITNYLKSYNDAATVDGWTNQEKADAFMLQLRADIVRRANQWKKIDAEETAGAAVTGDAWEE